MQYIQKASRRAAPKQELCAELLPPTLDRYPAAKQHENRPKKGEWMHFIACTPLEQLNFSPCQALKHYLSDRASRYSTAFNGQLELNITS